MRHKWCTCAASLWVILMISVPSWGTSHKSQTNRNDISPAMLPVLQYTPERYPNRTERDYEVYRSIVDRYNLLKTTDSVAKSLMRGTFVGATLATTAFGGPFTGASMNYALGEAGRLIEKAMDKRNLALLSDSLNNYRKASNDMHFSNIYKASKTSPDEAFRILEGYTSPVYREELKKLDTDGQVIANGFLISTLQDQIIANKLEQIATDQQQNNTLQEASSDIAAVSSQLSTFKHATQSNISELVQTQTSLQVTVTELDNRVQLNSKSILVLEQITFEKSSPKEQWTMLQKGVFSDISEEKRLAVKAAAEQQMLNEKLVSYVEGAQQISTVLNKVGPRLGISSNDIKNVNNVVKFGGAALNAYLSFQTGNVFGGIAAVSSLFGGGEDASAGQHREVMQGISLLLQGQKDILDGIDKLAQNQMLIMKTMTSLAQNLSQQLYDQHRETMDRLHVLDWKADASLKALQKLLSAKVDTCKLFYNRLIDVEKVTGRFVPYSTGAQILNSSFFRKDRCFTGILEVTEIRDQADPMYHLKTYSDAKSVTFLNLNAKDFIQTVYEPTLSLMKVQGRIDLERAELLMVPAHTLHDLDAKLERPNTWARYKLTDYLSSDEREALMSTALHHRPLINDSKLVLKLYRYFDVPTGGIFPAQSELLAKYGTVSFWEGQTLLSNLRNLINIAIAQQSILSGDVLLHEVNKCMQAQATCSEEYKKGLWSLLDKNPIFRTNYSRFVIHQVLKSDNLTNLSRYQAAFTSSDPTFMIGIFPKGWTFSLTEANADPQIAKYRWTVNVMGYKMLLPTPEEMTKGELIFTPDIIELSETRENIDAALFDYEFMGRMKNEEKDSMRRVLFGHQND